MGEQPSSERAAQQNDGGTDARVREENWRGGEAPSMEETRRQKEKRRKDGHKGTGKGCQFRYERLSHPSMARYGTWLEVPPTWTLQVPMHIRFWGSSQLRRPARQHKHLRPI